jgi:hypothetical protein
MLFSEQSPAFADRRDNSDQRHSLLSELLAAFQSSFPAIRYQIFSELNLLNGQALLLGTQRIVRLYGGVALHPAMGRDGLAFALLHETGHHLADGARLPWNPLISCECVADFWAFDLGHKILSNSTGWTVNIPKALDEVNALIETEADGTNVPQQADVRDFGACWAMRWNDRRASILGERSIPPDHACSLNYQILGPCLITDR